MKRKNSAAVQNTLPRLAFSIAEAVEILGVGRTLLYEAIRNGDLKTIKVGRRRLIRPEAIAEWLGDH